MRLKSVEVENFRAIKKCSIRFNELTALVGENNSGKTAILRALNSVFNYEYEENEHIAMHRGQSQKSRCIFATCRQKTFIAKYLVRIMNFT